MPAQSHRRTAADLVLRCPPIAHGPAAMLAAHKGAGAAAAGRSGPFRGVVNRPCSSIKPGDRPVRRCVAYSWRSRLLRVQRPNACWAGRSRVQGAPAAVIRRAPSVTAAHSRSNSRPLRRPALRAALRRLDVTARAEGTTSAPWHTRPCGPNSVEVSSVQELVDVLVCARRGAVKQRSAARLGRPRHARPPPAWHPA